LVAIVEFRREIALTDDGHDAPLGETDGHQLAELRAHIIRATATTCPVSTASGGHVLSATFCIGVLQKAAILLPRNPE